MQITPLNKLHKAKVTYIKDVTNVSFTQFESDEELFAGLNDSINYIIVPLTQYIDGILSNDYKIIYHFSDINIYYTLETNDSTLSNVLKKFCAKWDGFADTYNEALFKTFIESLNITDTEVDSIQSVTYDYGFVNASPYEVITGGKYGSPQIRVILYGVRRHTGPWPYSIPPTGKPNGSASTARSTLQMLLMT